MVAFKTVDSYLVLPEHVKTVESGSLERELGVFSWEVTPNCDDTVSVYVTLTPEDGRVLSVFWQTEDAASVAFRVSKMCDRLIYRQQMREMHERKKRRNGG